MGLLFVLSGVLSVVRSLARNVARNVARISSFFAILSVSKLSAFFCGVTFCVVRSAVSSQGVFGAMLRGMSRRMFRGMLRV